MYADGILWLTTRACFLYSLVGRVLLLFFYTFFHTTGGLDMHAHLCGLLLLVVEASGASSSLGEVEGVG